MHDLSSRGAARARRTSGARTTAARAWRGCLALLLSAVAWQPAGAADAQGEWRASQPVRVVVPFAAGGGADVAARLISQRLGDALGQPMVVDNKPGASGAIGSDLVYAAPADGSTLLLGTADTQSMNPYINKVRYDALKYVPVAGIAKVSYVLVGRPNLPAASLKELLALAKQQQLTYGSSGPGAALHIQMSMFANAARLNNLLHVPYQGAAPAFQALVAGQVDLAMVPVVLALQYKDKLRFYGVASLSRNDALRDVPTLAEQGYPVDGDPWVGVLAPPGTPAPTAATISRKVIEALAAPEVQKKLREVGMTPYAGSQAEFAEFYRREYAKWGAAIKAAGITKEE